MEVEVETGSESEQTKGSTLGRRTLLAGAAAGTALLATGLTGRPAMVQAAAKQYLDPNRLVVVAVGPVGADGKPLAGPKK